MAAAKKEAPGPALTPGSESHDPAVQHLLALRDIATRNGDDAAYGEYTSQLAELGYS